jgi:hypothetical protein
MFKGKKFADSLPRHRGQIQADDLLAFRSPDQRESVPGRLGCALHQRPPIAIPRSARLLRCMKLRLDSRSGANSPASTKCRNYTVPEVQNEMQLKHEVYLSRRPSLVALLNEYTHM